MSLQRPASPLWHRPWALQAGPWPRDGPWPGQGSAAGRAPSAWACVSPCALRATPPGAVARAGREGSANARAFPHGAPRGTRYTAHSSCRSCCLWRGWHLLSTRKCAGPSVPETEKSPERLVASWNSDSWVLRGGRLHNKRRGGAGGGAPSRVENGSSRRQPLGDRGTRSLAPEAAGSGFVQKGATKTRSLFRPFWFRHSRGGLPSGSETGPPCCRGPCRGVASPGAASPRERLGSPQRDRPPLGVASAGDAPQ